MKPLQITTSQRLYDLLREVPADEVLAQCRELYARDADGLRDAYKRLLRLKPNRTADYVIRAQVIVCKGKKYFEFSCVRPSAPSVQALALPWSYWLAARIRLSVLRRYPRAKLLAHTLRGMTLLGFSAAHIKRTVAHIAEEARLSIEKTIAEGIKPMSGEEFLGKGPGQKVKPDAPKMVFSPSFSKSFSQIPSKDQKKIKRSIAGLKTRDFKPPA